MILKGAGKDLFQTKTTNVQIILYFSVCEIPGQTVWIHFPF